MNTMALSPVSACLLHRAFPTSWLVVLGLTWMAQATRKDKLGDAPLEFQDILPENPKDYDKMHPPKENGNPTLVYFHVTVMSLDSIDESSMTYAADIFFAQSWKDFRLRLPDNMTTGYRLLPVVWLKDIWRPDAFFKNAKKVTFQEMTVPNHYIWLYKDKTLLYMVKLTLILSCAMNFKSYPHDTQQCAMKIESLSHTTDDLVFVWDQAVPLVVDELIELPQLDLASNTTGDCTQVYSTGNFTCLEVVFTFKRRLGYYLFHTYVPTCLIVIMSWISFWIKPEAVPARVTLGVTSLLTLSTQHANSQKALPPVSYIKAIDVFMSGCTVFVFFSLMEYALVNILLGDVSDGEESAVRRGVRNMMMAAKLLSSGKSQPQQQPQQSQPLQPPPLALNKMSPNASPLLDPSCSSSGIVGSASGSGVATYPSANCPVSSPSSPTSHVQSASAATAFAGAGVPGSNQCPCPPCTLGQPHQSNGKSDAVSSPIMVVAPGSASQSPVAMQSGSQLLGQRRRDRALLVDRFSRVLFPLSFSILNSIYWLYFVDWPVPLLFSFVHSNDSLIT